ncbi:Membrane carboxypeptidase (penicillin-binding protein) [Jatrophihabitans endophyticus]|uniref:Membrane carboxypeptidase (Penicillin-binding protein) n=1 Tax=Jatrophihabitans endophyticus TaxID=1206085 RepID=A0A1M5H483_9ACTN|nr:transglycosylase domain-containing protein [Jatrophihabitans endophyticus]SHG10790.1 Membrane carboxypeptidase (penicillin-binding protein) [Jatrophihabitans endophyticus]
MAATSSGQDTWKTLGKLVGALVAAGVLLAGLAFPYVGGLGLVAGKEADKFQRTTCDLPDSKPPQRSTLYAKDGKTVLATIFKQNRVEISLKDVPQALQDALIATEDRRFYSHHGVDMRGLIRSAVNTTSGDTQGGSTLTMQYVKQARYYEAGDDLKKQRAAIEQNLNRKIEDAKCAIYIEDTLKQSKKTILQNYLNIAFFGQNSYGIQTAARTYFNKPASKLEPQESALLVGLLRAPTDYDPFTSRVAAKERRDEVLQNMVAVHKFSQAQANEYKAMPIQLASDGPPPVRQGCAGADTEVANVGFFCEYVRSWLENVTGLSKTKLETGGFKIVTTLDPDIQNSTQANIAKSVPAKSPMTAVLPVIEPRTGNILAMAASKEFGTGKNETEQPLFTTSVAQPASTYKLFPLLTALEVGVPADQELDSTDGSADSTYKVTNCITPAKAENDRDGSGFNRNESLRSAAAKSSNTYFVALADKFFGCDLTEMVDVAQRLGVTSLSARVSKTETVGQYIENKQQALRYVLGSVETSPLQIAGAYAAVANEGKFNPPAPVSMVYNSDGNVVDTKRPAATQAVPAQAAVRAVNVLQGDTEDGGTSASQFADWYDDGGSKIAGKTGTAVASKKTKNASVWFAGMTPRLAATAAIINYDNPTKANSGLPGVETGAAYGKYAAGVWLKALRPTLGKKDWSWSDADSVSGEDVPDVTGKSVSAARDELSDAGYKLKVFGSDQQARCPSSVQTDDIAYFGPQRAPAGSTILVCQSNGAGTGAYVAPAPTPTRRSGSNNRNRNRDNDSSSRRGNGRSGSGNSGGRGGGNR